MNAFTIYLLMQCGDIKIPLIVIPVFFIILALIGLSAPEDLLEIPRAKYWNNIKKWVIAAICVFTFALFLPSTKTLIAMLGVTYINQVEGAKDIPPNLVKVLNKLISEYLEK